MKADPDLVGPNRAGPNRAGPNARGLSVFVGIFLSVAFLVLALTLAMALPWQIEVGGAVVAAVALSASIGWLAGLRESPCFEG